MSPEATRKGIKAKFELDWLFARASLAPKHDRGSTSASPISLLFFKLNIEFTTAGSQEVTRKGMKAKVDLNSLFARVYLVAKPDRESLSAPCYWRWRLNRVVKLGL